MKKITVELHREPSQETRYIQGDKFYLYGENTEFALNALVKATEKMDDIRVYRHIVTKSLDNERTHDWHGQDIHCAEEVYRLHIFYEETFE